MKPLCAIPYLVFIFCLISLQIFQQACICEAASSNERAAGGARLILKVHHNPPRGANLHIVGDVNDVIEGRVPPHASHTWYDASELFVGIGASSPVRLESLGEALVFNGHSYTLSTDPEDRYFETISGRRFLTTFTIGLPAGEHLSPDVSLHFDAYSKDNDNGSGGGGGGGGTLPFDLSALYTRLDAAFRGRPFCFYGLFEFKRLRSVSVSKAPIYGENLFGEHQDDYYSQPAFDLSDTVAVTVGCAANFSNLGGQKDAQLREQLSKVLYFNPLDDQGKGAAAMTGLSTHSHAVSLKLKPAELDDGESFQLSRLRDIEPADILGVYHMLSNSEIRRAHVHALQIEGVKDVTKR